MTVKEDVIERENGAKGVFGIVEKPDFAVIAAIKNGEVCLVEQHRYPVASRFWELPQGSWESSSSAPELAKAELHKRRASLQVPWSISGTSFSHTAILPKACRFYGVRIRALPQDLDTEEHGLVAKFFPISDVEAMIAGGKSKMRRRWRRSVCSG
jgi:hypothetical protein